MYEDIYYFSFTEALKNAKLNNKVVAKNGIVEATQICYYDGYYDNSNIPENCIGVPNTEFVKYFSNTSLRLPNVCNVDGTSLDVKDEEQNFLSNLELVNKIRENITKELEVKIKSQKINFSDKHLRIFAHACRETVLIKYVTKNIIESFEKLGFTVFLHQQKSEFESCNKYSYLESLYNFNPHVTININHMQNQFLNDNVFNFVWFQDLMPILTNEIDFNLRKRDFIFSLLEDFDKLLYKKGIPKEKLFRQPITTSERLYNNKYNVVRENKIVFIGDSFQGQFENRKNESLIIKEIQEKLNLNQKINFDEIVSTFEIDINYLKLVLYPAVLRQEIVSWTCKQKLVSVEIYGRGWENINFADNFYKGILPYGEEIAKVYNSAKYSIVISPNSYYQQRLFEMSLCGTIPLIYDDYINNEEFRYKDNAFLFSTYEEMFSCLDKEPKENPELIGKKNTYEKFANKILKIIEDNIVNN